MYYIIYLLYLSKYIKAEIHFYEFTIIKYCQYGDKKTQSTQRLS